METHRLTKYIHFANALRNEKLSTRVHMILRSFMIAYTAGNEELTKHFANELSKWIRKERIRISFETYNHLADVDRMIGNIPEEEI